MFFRVIRNTNKMAYNNNSNTSTYEPTRPLTIYVIKSPLLVFLTFVGLSLIAFNIFTIWIVLRSKKLNRPYNFPIISVLMGSTLQSLFFIPVYAFKRLGKVCTELIIQFDESFSQAEIKHKLQFPTERLMT